MSYLNLPSVTSALCLFICLSSNVQAQLEVVVHDTLTPVELVQNVLLGAGVTVSNVEVTGAIPADQINQQFGEYVGPSDVIDFNRGFMMTTSNVLGILQGGPNGVNGANNVQNDPDLMILSGQNMNNCAIIEFDFVPNGDSLEFRYVFASHEYPSFTCSNFNDAFGFFISGPGINGPFSDNSENIALIPGTDIPVSINSVNQGFPSGNNPAPCLAANPNFANDSIYFVNNQNPTPGDIITPGMTTTLTAYADVICGETYHIKLAIGNASDQGLQSFVFLESESFSSNSAVQVLLDIPVGINDSTLYRGCGEASLKFARPVISTGLQEVAYLQFSGSAVNGVDVFPIVPDSVVFAPGVDTVAFTLTAPFLGQTANEESFTITISNVASECGGITLTSSFTFYINDADPLAIEPGFTTEFEDCNDEVQLIPEVSGGYGVYKYQWSTGSTAETITVSPGFTTNYFLTVSDTCNAGSVSTTFPVEVPVYPPIIVTLPDDIVLDICDVPVNVLGEAEGGFGDYTYTWRDMNTNQIIGEEQLLEYIVATTTTLRLIVTDECGATGLADIEVVVPPVDVTVFLPDMFTATNCLDEILMPAISEGGIGNILYSWYADGEQVGATEAQFFSYHPSMGQNVVIRAEDECGNFGLDSTFVEFNFPPITAMATPDTSICPRTGALLRVQGFGGTDFLRYQWLQSGQTTDTLLVAPGESTRYDYVISDTCGVQYEGSIRVDIREIVANFEFDPIEYYGVQIRNLSRPLMQSTYFWDFGDGNTSTEINPKHFFNGTDNYTITLTTTDSKGCEAEFSRTTVPPVELFIPSAFSPDGDGINELWRVEGSNVREFEIWIYDRWGQEVFRSKDMTQGWDGSHQGGAYHNNMTLYNYFIRYKGELEEDAFERTGTIVVIR